MRTSVLSSLLSLSLLACGSSESGEAQDSDITLKSAYTTDFGAFNQIFGSSFSTVEEAYTLQVKAGPVEFPAATHLFGNEVNIIPYSDVDSDTTTDGDSFRGDREIARVFKKGDIGIGLKHHRSEYSMLDLNDTEGGSDALKEHFKLQDTHIEVVVGVERDGQPGAITVNNPQDYQDGLFGDADYPMVFLRPVYPIDNAAKIAAYQDNVRTMLVGLNAVTNFPGDYNGGDPLGGRNPERIREYVEKMILAVTGDSQARAWFEEDANQVYCAELAFLALSAGVLVPLNDANAGQLVDSATWTEFKKILAAHNAGEETSLLEFNDNKRVALINDLTVAPDDLTPIADLLSADAADKLALEPMTMADIVEQFMRTTIPREVLGESLAPVQAALLQAMQPALMESMGVDKLPEEHPARVGVEAIFAQLIAVTGEQYADYAAFRAALEPVMEQARAATGPRGDTGVGLFAPPHLFHLVAQGKHTGGLFGMQYEGHGVHLTAVKKASSADAPVVVTPVEEIANEASCADSCGRMAAGGCFCDAECTANGDCCEDYTATCGG